MKKTTFITLMLSTLSILFFAVGMCMALIPEWNAFTSGVVFSVIGIILGIITIINHRRMTGKPPVKISRKTAGTTALGIAGALVLGTGMCLCMVWNRMIPGIITGIIGIVMLLSLIPMIKGLKD